MVSHLDQSEGLIAKFLPTIEAADWSWHYPIFNVLLFQYLYRGGHAATQPHPRDYFSRPKTCWLFHYVYIRWGYTPIRHQGLNSFWIFYWHWRSLSLLHSQGRKAQTWSCAQLWLYSINTVRRTQYTGSGSEYSSPLATLIHCSLVPTSDLSMSINFYEYIQHSSISTHEQVETPLVCQLLCLGVTLWRTQNTF